MWYIPAQAVSHVIESNVIDIVLIVSFPHMARVSDIVLCASVSTRAGASAVGHQPVRGGASSRAGYYPGASGQPAHPGPPEADGGVGLQATALAEAGRPAVHTAAGAAGGHGSRALW